MQIDKNFRLILNITCLLLGLAAQAHADATTTGNAAQWKNLCSDGSVSCSYIRTSQGMETYHVCANGNCYAVLCNSHSPDAVCLKDELPGKRPPSRKMQAGILELL